DRLRRRLAPRFGDHRGREVDAGHLVPSPDELEAQEAGAAADVERVERTTAGEDEVQDAIPGGAFGGRADAVTEVLVESRSAAVPVRRDLLLDGIDHRRLYSALTIVGARRMFRRRHHEGMTHGPGRPLRKAGRTDPRARPDRRQRPLLRSRTG